MINILCLICLCLMGICMVLIGVFLGCFGYGLLLKECCKIIINLGDEEGVINVFEEDVEIVVLCVKKCCLICEMVMDVYLIDDKCKLYVCGNNLNCEGFIVEEGEFKVKGYEGLIVECDKCGLDMVLKNGCFGKYMGCINDVCKNMCKILKNGEVVLLKEELVYFFELFCENLDVYFVLCDGVFGLFFVVSNFFKLCEMCVFLVEELKCFVECLLEKY